MEAKKFNIYLLTVLFFLSLSSCEKPIKKIYHITDFEKQFCSYNVGSYWIYQNDSTLQEDSVYVDAFDYANIGQEVDRDQYTYEGLISSCKSTGDSTSSIYYMVQAQSDNDAVLYYGLNYCCDTNHTSWSTRAFMINNNPFLGSNGMIISPINQLTVNGNVFNAVYKFKTDDFQDIASNPQMDSVIVFANKDVGIVQWSIYYSAGSVESWSVLRQHIVR